MGCMSMLEILRTSVDLVLGNWLWVALLNGAEGLDKTTSRGPFQLQPFCDPVIFVKVGATLLVLSSRQLKFLAPCIALLLWLLSGKQQRM